MFFTELPNCLIHTNPNEPGNFDRILNQADRFIKILSDCPFSVEYFNQKYNWNKFQYTFSPYNNKYFPEIQEKIYDVYYTGNFPSPIDFSIPVIAKFKHCIVSSSSGTHINASHLEKMKLNSQSKISIIHGLLSWRYPEVKDRFPGHKAFEHVNEFPFVPQIKTRTFEAAISKSLILSLHDPWNMIESYLIPGKDFLYWYDIKDLEDKIRHIILHYDEYESMIESAYNKVANNWTTRHFFKQYLENL